MPLPCPAHDSRVTMLAGASDLITNTPTECEVPSQTALVSYGKVGDRFHVWGVRLDEEEFVVTLQLLLVVKMATRLRHISLMASTACVALDDNRVIMFRTLPEAGRPLPKDMVQIGSLMLEEHEEEEEHANEVTSLGACPYLQLFVSASRDGTVKLWSFDNWLVSEIDFGVALSAVAFANTQGDLLVSLQQQISIVRAVDYLPASYGELSRSCQHWDHKEKPVGFDPYLEFW